MNAFEGCIGQMSTSHHSCLVSSIMFDIKDEMCGDLLTSLWDSLLVELSFVDEGWVFVKLVHLRIAGFVPSLVSVFFIKADCFVPISWHTKSVFTSRRRAKGPQSHLVCKLTQLLLPLGASFETAPSWEIQHIVLQGALCCRDGIVIFH